MNNILRIILATLLIGCSNDDEHIRFPNASAQNIDAGQLELAFENFSNINDIRSLVVSRNEIIVAEEYFNGTGPELIDLVDLHVMSVTKSITSTLVGIAIDKGFIQSINQTVSDFLGDEVVIINAELGEVTIEQLLTMTAGHDWKEINDGSEYLDWIESPNQVEYIVSKQLIDTPGTVFDYSDGAAHLVSYIIEKATGMNTSIFADKYLFEPMGIGERAWYVDNQKVSLGGVGLIIGPYDMQKIGYLYLNDGFYNNQQIVSSSWINQATTSKLSTGNILPYLSSYGYYWWIGNAHGIDYICAVGYGGQFILISKEKKLVITATCDYQVSRAEAGTNWTNIFDTIINDILVAVD